MTCNTTRPAWMDDPAWNQAQREAMSDIFNATAAALRGEPIDLDDDTTEGGDDGEQQPR